MRTCIIFNPTARGDKAQQFRRALARLASQCVLKPTTGPGAATPLTAEAVREGFATVVAAGGDGTVSEVVSGLASTPGGLEQARLGVVPLGTVNVFAKELDLPHALAPAWAVIERGRETRVDLPRVEFTAEGQPQGRWFIQLAGAGFDARAVELVEWEWKRRTGLLAYGLAVLRAKRGTLPLVTAQGGGQQATGEQVLIGNGRFYAGRLPVFPQGDLRDGLLEVRVFPKLDWAALIHFGWAWLTERPFRRPGEVCFRAESVTLSSPSPVPFQVDGDTVGRLPATFSLRRQALRVIVP
jgi:YegS/Rv2252/BmrU family lipid kinase